MANKQCEGDAKRSTVKKIRCRNKSGVLSVQQRDCYAVPLSLRRIANLNVRNYEWLGITHALQADVNFMEPP